MANVDGKLRAQIDVSDVRNILGASSSKINELCVDANINKWAKYKPVNVVKSDGAVTESERAGKKYGLAWSGTANLSTFTYERPEKCFRIGDFSNGGSKTLDGYNHTAPCGFMPKSIPDYNIVSDTDDLIITNNDDETCVTFVDVKDTLFSRFSSVYLQLLAYDARTDYSYTSEAASMNNRTISFSVPKSVLRNLNVGKVAARFVFNDGTGYIMASPSYTFFDIVGVEDVLELNPAWDGSSDYPKLGNSPASLAAWSTYRAGMSSNFLNITNTNLYMEFGLKNLSSSRIQTTSVCLMLTWTNENGVPVYTRCPLYFYTGSVSTSSIPANGQLSGTYVVKDSDLAKIGTRQTVNAVLQYLHPTAGYVSFGNKINLNFTRTNGNTALAI